MYSKLLFLVTASIICCIGNGQKVILMSSSLGYYNIRQVSNIVKVYHHFRNNGLTDEDISLFIS